MDLLRHLGFFVAVAEEGHFGRAAERLGMTQPPVSQGVQRLERRLGVELFHRGSRGVGLTPAGSSLLPQAYSLLSSASEFAASAGRLRDQAVRVGVIGQLSAFHLAAMVSSAPKAVVVTTAATVELIEAVTSGQLDCAVVHHPALVNTLECGPVIRVPSWFLVPSGREDLRGLSCATIPRSHGTAAFDLLADTLRASGLDPDFLAASNDREVVAAVATGQAFGITTDPFLQAPGIARLPAAEFGLRVRLVWRSLAADVRSALEAALA
ncbi:DNA-binding transcriptional LysR family regulator [Kibdelosporangium banguiense]|uniref:DNA-binding transcriptional LysR family regulator n=1 Tax=Kibdelosporangium banguiense TaxID=1365924 RepID=A0ABS4T9C1_9PSEU|nr:LysR family transcriptional regulator [Kibdelosporangium banguiense]MBP2320998.1 DNA-binding transcriptional LysR family regulator [Kibdelosporangium banguiense]